MSMRISLNQTYSFKQLGNRRYQEDSRFPDEDEPLNSSFFCVCDGVGGEKDGKRASATVTRSFAQSLSEFDKNKESLTIDMFRKILLEAYQALDQEAEKGADKSMATTMTFVCFHQGGAFVAHIGDSRIYHIRPHVGILYRSSDHSLVNAMVHEGSICPAEAENHERGNVITRYMAPRTEDHDRCCASVLQIHDIMPGDYFFLCSDGVIHCLTDEQLVSLLETDISDQEKNSVLARSCEKSEDNNTAILISVRSVQKENETENDTEYVGNSITRKLKFSELSPELKEVEPAAEKNPTLLDRLFSILKFKQ